MSEILSDIKVIKHYVSRETAEIENIEVFSCLMNEYQSKG